MYKDKKIVVAMPAYNAAKTLQETSGEMVNQGIVDLVVIVCDASRMIRLRQLRNCPILPFMRIQQISDTEARWIHLDVPRHLYHFDPVSLRFCLENTGFQIGRTMHHEFEYNLMGWSQSMLNHLNRTPNIFLDFLSGKGKHHPVWICTSNFILGSILTVASIAALPAEALMGRCGTLVTIAYKKV